MTARARTAGVTVASRVQSSRYPGGAAENRGNGCPSRQIATALAPSGLLDQRFRLSTQAGEFAYRDGLHDGS
jgi:hypothetical protein